MKRRKILQTYIVSSDDTGKAFFNAFSSLWDDAKTGFLSPNEQQDRFWNKFHVRIYNFGYNLNGYRTATMEFESKEAFVLFMLEWS